MEEVIKQIIEIETIAQRIIDDALEEKKRKEEEHKQRLEELENKTIREAKEKVEQIREREFNDIKEEEEAKLRRCDKRLNDMDIYAKEHMEQWVLDLVKRVID